MSQVLITGATGLVGGHLLRMLINEPKVNAIAAPTRRPLGDMPGVFNPHDPQVTRWRRSPIPSTLCFVVSAPRGEKRGAKRRLFMPITRW